MGKIERFCTMSAITFFAIGLLFLTPGQSRAGSEKGVVVPEKPGVHDPIMPGQTTRVKVVNIDGKAESLHLIYIGERRLRVAPTATILNYSRSPIPLKLMPVPCRAEVTYQIFGDHRDPMVHRIELK